jgi:hypothetical protein
MRPPLPRPWTCPQCGRTVPAREPQCHCGVLWRESPDAHRADEGAGASSGLGRAVLALVVVAAAGYGLYVAAQHREARIQAAEAAAQDRIRLERTPAGGVSAPPETVPRVLAPSPYTPPVGGGFTFPSPRAEAPAAIKPRPSPADDGSASPTSMEEAWARATELLESPLQKITEETAELQQRYSRFAYACLASPDANWLVAMKSGAFVQGGIPYNKFGVVMDCEFARRQLVARGNVLKAELETAEKLARANSVLPGHWRKLVESHQLDVWDAY